MRTFTAYGALLGAMFIALVSPLAHAGPLPEVSDVFDPCVQTTAPLAAESLADVSGGGCDLQGRTVRFPNDVTMAIPAPGETLTRFINVNDLRVDYRDLSVVNAGSEGVVAIIGDGASAQFFGPSAALAEVAGLPHFMEDSVAASLTEPKESESGGALAAAVDTGPKCTSTQRNTSGRYQGAVYSWSFNPNPNYSSILSGVRGGFNWMVDTVNDCGSPATAVNATSSYPGTTTRGANVYGDAECAPADGFNTVNFGGLPSTINAVTCRLQNSSGQITQADIAFNSSRKWTLSNATSTSLNCPSGYMRLYDIAAHEVGHAFGLGHVSEGSPLIMDPSEGTCDPNVPNGIGRGDYLGMLDRYPS